ncbi:MAG: aspartate carbamoyltransferase [Puniceicoccaceae bacterium]
MTMFQNLEPNKIAPNLKPPEGSEHLHPQARALFEENPINVQVLSKLENESILKVKQFDKETVIELAKLAAILEDFHIAPYHVLDGKIATTAFFEASTRTRLSFESAVQRLGGRILSIPEGGVTGVKKGESLEDIGEMFNAYCDMVIMRHTETDCLKRILKHLRVPLINAGNGTGEHPTQALADWYALLKWRPGLADEKDDKMLNLGILGTPGQMRAVKSFLLMSLLFRRKIRKVTVISEMADPFGLDITEALDGADIDYEVTNDIQEALPTLDVIYMNSIALLGESYQQLGNRYMLNSESKLKPESVILHPLARLKELDTSLDNTQHNLYFTQAHGAVFIRQALLISVFGRLDRLPDDIPLLK